MPWKLGKRVLTTTLRPHGDPGAKGPFSTSPLPHRCHADVIPRVWFQSSQRGRGSTRGDAAASCPGETPVDSAQDDVPEKRRIANAVAAWRPRAPSYGNTGSSPMGDKGRFRELWKNWRMENIDWKFQNCILNGIKFDCLRKDLIMGLIFMLTMTKEVLGEPIVPPCHGYDLIAKDKSRHSPKLKTYLIYLSVCSKQWMQWNKFYVIFQLQFKYCDEVSRT